MNEIKDFKKFEKEAKDQGYIYCDLFSHDNKKLLTRNRLKGDFESNLKKIFAKLESSVTSPGTYIIRCYVAPASEPEIFVYHKGGVKTLGENSELPKTITIIEKQKEPKSPDVLTYEKALEYQNEISRLTFENADLRRQIEALEEELEDYEEEEEERENNPATMGDNNPMKAVTTAIENIMATALPVLDRHYKYKEDLMKLEWAKITKTIPAQAPQQQQQPSPMDQLEQKVNAWLDKISTENQELYAKLEEMSTQVTSLEEYLQAIQKSFPEKFLELESFVTQN